MNDIEELIIDIVEEYVRRWKSEGKRYINVKNFKQVYAENNVTPIELESTLVRRLPELNKTNPSIPPGIPQLPYNVLKRLPIHLTKSLEIQVNWDHYEYWGWSAEVFQLFKKQLSILRETDLWSLLFRIALARLGYLPGTLEARILNQVIDIAVDRHVKHIIFHKYIIGIPIGAATLEYLLKSYIRTNGPPEAQEKLKKLEQLRRATFGNILRIFEERVLPYTSQDFRNGVKELNKIVENIWGTDGNSWIDILIDWRNNFIHGAETWAPRAFGVYLNYICLILWHSIPEDDYETKREQLLRRLKFTYTPLIWDDFWSFYPP